MSKKDENTKKVVEIFWDKLTRGRTILTKTELDHIIKKNKFEGFLLGLNACGSSEMNFKLIECTLGISKQVALALMDEFKKEGFLKKENIYDEILNYCSQCGSALDGDKNFCNICGIGTPKPIIREN